MLLYVLVVFLGGFGQFVFEGDGLFLLKERVDGGWDEVVWRKRWFSPMWGLF